MKRRDFLKYNALAAFGVATIPLYANEPSHANHNMDNMNHAKTMHIDIDTSFITLEDENIKLLDPKFLPSNKPLSPLKLLKNLSSNQGEFKASIEIEEIGTEIIKGKKTKHLAYIDASMKNASFLAPKIEVFEGDYVEIEVKNNLKEPTTIHWHGLPVPPEEDGNPHDPILAGKSRIYHFTLNKDCAGTYWYHPHPHYITSRQVYQGLAGAFVVKSRKDAISHLKEQDWFISDLRLDSHAQIPANALSDWLDGREGEFVLINGQYKPQISLDSMQRIRIYNACSARYLQLQIQGASFVLVGTDGGLIEEPIKQDMLFLAPASRVEVVIQNQKSGNFKLTSLLYDRDKMMPKESPKVLELADIKLFAPSKENVPKSLRILPKLQNSKGTREIIMSEDHSNMNGFSQKSKEEIRKSLAALFLVNGAVFEMSRVDLRVKLGEVIDFIVTNKSHMDHPFHIHGTQFELIESTFKGQTQKPSFRALQDTINVKPNETLRLRMKQDFAGLRMFHCHILEHEDLGMMGVLEVKA